MTSGKSDGCLHPSRGGQEHMSGMGTGDYYCQTCHEPMPIIGKPAVCIECGSESGNIAPEPTLGKSWHCSDCGKNWGWVRS